MENFTNLNLLSNEELADLIDTALAYKHGEIELPTKGHYVTNLFFENSTRTQSSFQMAEQRLGWNTIQIDPSTSSTSKGETIADTLKTLGAIGVEVVVMRHSQNDWYAPLLAERSALLPKLVNGGDGSGQHPSQSLLDLITIYEEFGHFEGLNIRIVGDLSHSRVAHSNAEILQRLGANLTFAGPAEWYPTEFNRFGHWVDMDEDIEQLDVMMMLRVQHERMAPRENGQFSKQEYHETFGLSEARYSRLNDHAIIMHPAPVNRDVEIADRLVEAAKSRIFKQMTNGVYARMAILTKLYDDAMEEVDTAEVHYGRAY
ncbi:aspartate carbamoyltransferase catalyticsubunit [Weissella oryzae SG25]|uniref:Aspartate carbamoyltransferase n=1 Tax=Weissella oryzae (strain DSM 25784 / JCM 18191 / LMG 30913 / SG25) TaxID=1329250 RepID=A0A069CTU2_WEIOS|nr:aspartate carbamoyltransferase catalytic subunit [Weissella oryzae]GAK30909.1 aspartate carbamoyltransferase catalyticsubunit [Weissella oryzae SG25]